MHRIVVSYRLKPGITIEQFSAWSVAVDQEIVRAQEPVGRFEVFAAAGPADPGADIDVFEVIEVSSWDEWQSVLAGPAMAPALAQFDDLVDASTVRVVYGNVITA